MSEDRINGYWFAASNQLPHGDGRLITLGKTHHKRGEIIICNHGFHCSRDPFDALQYAPGSLLYRVQVWGDVQEQDDKLCGRHRTYLGMRDANVMLRHFARRQALTCIDAWSAPQVVRDWLETGEPALQSAAQVAAKSAPRNAQSAPWNAPWSAAQSAVWSAARSASWSAAESTSESAAWSAARSAARSAAWSAVESAARRAAERAARRAPRNAQSADWSAAQSAAWSATWSAARKMFGEMVTELFAKEPEWI